MRALCVCFVLFSAAASAQPGLEAENVESSWRVAVDGGFTSPALAPSVSVRAERTVRGALAVGGRGWGTLNNGFMADGASLDGGGAEGFAAIAEGLPWLVARGRAGVGLAILDYSSGGIGCEPEFEECVSTRGGGSVEGVRPYAVGSLGFDLYPVPNLGVGAELHLALMDGPATVSSGGVGVRVRW
ncbi:MAG: hypothetical protein Rubg2KO_14900 [Rubricoccaceae bacterium]